MQENRINPACFTHGSLYFPHISNRAGSFSTRQMYLLETDQPLPAIRRIQSQFKKAWSFLEQMHIIINKLSKEIVLISWIPSYVFLWFAFSFLFLYPACGREESWPSSRGSALCPPLVSLSTTCWELRRWPQRMILRDHTGEASLCALAYLTYCKLPPARVLWLFFVFYAGNWRWSSTLTRILTIQRQQISSRR